jgi:DNA-directed RNA polymerase specialized sigma24 family protein
MSVDKIEELIEEWGKSVLEAIEFFKFVQKKMTGVYRRLYPDMRAEIAETMSTLLGLNEDSTKVNEEEELDFPKIEDYSPELKKQRMIKQVKNEIKRVRKLTAEDMVDIFLLHSDKRLSGRKIGEKFGVSEKTVRQTVRKVRECTKTKS